MGTELEQKNGGHRYDLEQVLRGLTAVAYANGNSTQAARDLEEDGITIPQKTLWRWAMRTHREDYERIRREILPVVGAAVADKHMALADRQIDLASELAERLSKEAGDLPIRDVPGAMRNASVGAGIHTDKARDLQGDFATPPTPTRTSAELLRELAAEGMVLNGDVEDEEEEAMSLTSTT
jgi:hypothetical protein